MIDKKIVDITNQLRTVLNEQMADARSNLENLPDGETKDDLNTLLNTALSGKISGTDVQKELKKILEDAGND